MTSPTRGNESTGTRSREVAARQAPSAAARRLRATLVAAAWVALSVPSLAQEPGRFELVGGLTTVGAADLVDGVGAGWLVGGGWHPARWLAVVVDIDRSTHGSEVAGLEVDASLLGTLAGARVTTKVGPVRPLAHVLGGQSQIGIRARSSFPVVSAGEFFEHHGAVQLGGGVDIPIHPRGTARIAIDYRRLFAPDPFWQRRLSIAAVYRLGGQ